MYVVIYVGPSVSWGLHFVLPLDTVDLVFRFFFRSRTSWILNLMLSRDPVGLGSSLTLVLSRFFFFDLWSLVNFCCWILWILYLKLFTLTLDPVYLISWTNDPTLDSEDSGFWTQLKKSWLANRPAVVTALRFLASILYDSVSNITFPVTFNILPVPESR